MENNNFLLKRKIKSNPLTIRWVDYFLKNHVSEVILQPLKKGEVGSIRVVNHNEEETARIVACISLEKFPFLKFTIRIDPEKHKKSWVHQGDFEGYMGSTLIHECAHPKYHLWAWMDEISTNSPGYWHHLIDGEAQRFSKENRDYVISLARKVSE